MQHYYAREIEANHRRREFERQLKAQALASLADSRHHRSDIRTWWRWGIGRWRALLASRFAISHLLPTPMTLAKRDA